MATLPQLHTFTSSTNPARSVQYTHLNPNATHTLVFCYGAGGSSMNTTLFQRFIDTHDALSVLCVDRWTQTIESGTPKQLPASASLLDDLSSITMELLDSLKIKHFSIAAHSAGAYPLLSLIRACGTTSRVKNVFPMCTHVPNPYNQSKLLSTMSKMPDFLFKATVSLDQMDPDSPLAKAALSLFGSTKDETAALIYEPEDRSRYQAYKPDTVQKALDRDRQNVDYCVTFGRFPYLGVAEQTQLYKEIEIHQDINYVWFTTDGDLFYNAAAVNRVLKDVKNSRVEIVNVEGATHADIFYRTDVWERVYQQITATGST